METVPLTSLTLEDLLLGICQELQISPSKQKTAEERYASVVAYLEKDPFFLGKCLDSYAQGSLRHGTTVKPLIGEEYDLDFVFPTALHGIEARVLLTKIESCLEKRGIYRLDKSKNTASRIVYADEFHIDIVPALPLEANRGRVEVPHRQNNEFRFSNPEGFSRWLDRVAVEEPVAFIGQQAMRIRAEALPLPSPESIQEKPPLKKVIQLLKRNRDIRFQDKADTLKPPSMLITAMAGLNYGKELTVAETLRMVVDRILVKLPDYRQNGVLNPAATAVDPIENLARSWEEDSRAYYECEDWLQELATQWYQIARVDTLHEKVKGLIKLFGDPARTIYDRYVQEIQSARTENKLGITSSGLLITSPTILTGKAVATPEYIPSPEHTFYGG